MQCKFCGGTQFSGHQLCRMDVLVGEDGNFLSNLPGGAESNIYDAERPYGPFICQGCGAEYDSLQDGAEPTSGPVKDWEILPVIKAQADTRRDGTPEQAAGPLAIRQEQVAERGDFG